jgi:hypothetical protein
MPERFTMGFQGRNDEKESFPWWGLAGPSFLRVTLVDDDLV